MAIGPNWAADTGPFRGGVRPPHEYGSQRQSRARGPRGWGRGPGRETGSQTQFLVPGTGPKPASAPGAPPPAPSPLDSTYYQNMENENFRVGNQVNSLNQTEAFKRQDLQNALAQLAKQQPLDTLKTQESANKQGLLYSGHLGQAIGDLNRGYLTRQTGLQDNYQRSAGDIASRISALQQGLLIFDRGQRLLAAQRGSLAAQKNPALGLPLPPAQQQQQQKAAPKPGPKPGQKQGQHQVRPGRGHEFGSQRQWAARY